MFHIRKLIRLVSVVFRVLFNLIWSLRGEIYVASVCGHTTARAGFLRVFGKICRFYIMETKNGIPDYCIRCLEEKHSIRCPICGSAIAVGDRIGLCSRPVQTGERFRLEPFHKQHGTNLVCCRKCADPKGQPFKWMPSGVVELPGG